MSQVDQKRAFNKLKHQLEPCRSLVLKVHALLTWRKNYFPGIVFGLISIIFLTLWALDLAVITFISLTLLFVVLSDYFIPTILRLLGNSEKWVGGQEAEFDDVCTSLCTIKNTMFEWYDFLYNQDKSTLFTIMFSVSMLTLAWLGSTINNLLLMYLLTLSLAMWPGMQKNQIFKVFSDHCSKIIQSKVKTLDKKNE